MRSVAQFSNRYFPFFLGFYRSRVSRLVYLLTVSIYGISSYLMGCGVCDLTTDLDDGTRYVIPRILGI